MIFFINTHAACPTSGAPRTDGACTWAAYETGANGDANHGAATP